MIWLFTSWMLCTIFVTHLNTKKYEETFYSSLFFIDGSISMGL